MNQKEKEFHQQKLATLYMSIHLTVLYENDFKKQVGGIKGLEQYRNGILDNINAERKILGLLKR